MNIFKSRTFWTVVATFLINGVQAVHSTIPTGLVPFVDLALAMLTIYYHINPSQTYNAPDTTGSNG